MVFAVFLSFVLCSLHSLLYMRFYCQIGILAFENRQNSIYSYRHLTFLLVVGVTHAFVIGTDELNVLTELDAKCIPYLLTIV